MCFSPKRQVSQHLGRDNAIVLSLTARTQLPHLVNGQSSCRRLECPSLRLYCPLLFSHNGEVSQDSQEEPPEQHTGSRIYEATG